MLAKNFSEGAAGLTHEGLFAACFFRFLGDHRTAIMVLGVYFAVGLAILRGVDLRRGRAAALGA